MPPDPHVDLELVARFIEYCQRPEPTPMRSFYLLLGYDMPEFRKPRP